MSQDSSKGNGIKVVKQQLIPNNNKQSLLQLFWSFYIKQKSPIKLSQMLDKYSRKDIEACLKDIKLLKYNIKTTELEPNLDYLNKIFTNVLAKHPNINPFEIPATFIGETHYGQKCDESLKSFFSFKCQQKIFLESLGDIFIRRKDDLYMFKPLYDERNYLLALFWETFDKNIGYTSFTTMTKHKKFAITTSDLQNKFRKHHFSFIATKNGLELHLLIENIKNQIVSCTKEKEVQDIPHEKIKQIRIDGLSFEEYYGANAKDILAAIRVMQIKIDQKSAAKEMQSKQKVLNTSTAVENCQGWSLEDIVRLNLSIKNFIINNIDNKSIVDRTGYVSLEILHKNCLSNEESIKGIQDVDRLIEVIRDTPSIKKEGYRYGYKTDDDGNKQIRFSNLLFLLDNKKKKEPFVWLLESMKEIKLKEKILEENWDKEDSPDGILSKYIREYFDCATYGGYLHYDGDSVATSKTIIFNTGLILRDNYQDMFFIFRRKTVNSTFFIQVSDDLDLPDGFMAKDIRPIKFFSELNDVILETSLVELSKTHYEHILKGRSERFPKEIQELYEGRYIDFRNRLKEEIGLSLTKCRRDYRFALPQIYFGDVGFLLPIYFEEQRDKSKPAVLLGITKVKTRGERKGQKYYYKIRTCLTPEMAYANARIIAKPDNNWLK